MDGWIKVHRQIMENPLLMKGDYLSTWVYILMSVNHVETSELLAGKVVKIKPGQGIFSTPKMSKILDIHVSKIRRVLKTFENEQQIEQRTTNQGTVITVLNWDKYQQREQPNEQRVNNDCTTTEQRVNNLPYYTKNDKNGKNGEKGRHKRGTYQNVLLSDEDLQKLQAEFPGDWQRRIDRLSEYMRSTGKSYKDHLATIRAWARKDAERQRPAGNHPWNDAQAGYEGALKKLEGLIDEQD